LCTVDLHIDTYYVDWTVCILSQKCSWFCIFYLLRNKTTKPQSGILHTVSGTSYHICYPLQLLFKIFTLVKVLLTVHSILSDNSELTQEKDVIVITYSTGNIEQTNERTNERTSRPTGRPTIQQTYVIALHVTQYLW